MGFRLGGFAFFGIIYPFVVGSAPGSKRGRVVTRSGRGPLGRELPGLPDGSLKRIIPSGVAQGEPGAGFSVGGPSTAVAIPDRQRSSSWECTVGEILK